MDGTDRNLEIPTRGLVPQPIKDFADAGAGTQKPSGPWETVRWGARRWGRGRSLSFTSTLMSPLTPTVAYAAADRCMRRSH